MEKKELRIGNLVSDINASDSFFAEVKRLSYRRCYYGLFDCKYSDLKPILLTEEWLLKFNINELLNQDVYRINYVSYHKGNNTFNYCLVCYHNEYGYVDNIFKEIKYVHQLQNLYFALTGQELTLNN
jgi:hypothetical protein